VKFTPDGGSVSVHGRVRRGMVTIAISDDGIGIPKAALHKLGRPFEQVESQLTKRYQGSGLGLAIAKSLVEMHGGAMRIRSSLGNGTTVVVRLPLRSPAVQPADTGHEGCDDAGREPPDLWQAAGGGSVMPPTSAHAAIAMG
jgi:two-component system cell cycle sensor histidine kinase PleC